MQITLTQLKEKEACIDGYQYFENANLDNKSLNHIASRMFEDGKYDYFFWLVEEFGLTKYLSEYSDILLRYINIKDNDGQTPSHWACRNGYTKIAELLKKFITNK